MLLPFFLHFAEPLTANPENWSALKQARQYDQLVRVIETDLPSLEPNMRLEGLILLAEVHAQHMVDFRRAEECIHEARELNLELFNASFESTTRRLSQISSYLRAQKGQQTIPDTCGTSRFERAVRCAFRAGELSTSQRNVCRNDLEAEPVAADALDKRALVCAALIMLANAAQDDDEVLRETTKLVDLRRQLGANAAEYDKRMQHGLRSARRSRATSLLESAYTYVALGGVTAITLGTVWLDENEASVGRSWFRDTRRNGQQTADNLARYRELSDHSAFAADYNLFLTQHQQIALFEAIGQAHLRKGHREEAVHSFERAIEKAELFRTTLVSDADKLAYRRMRERLYADMIATLMDLGRAREAFIYSERARARAFLDGLQQNRVVLANSRDNAKYAALAEKTSELAALQNRLVMNESQRDFARHRGIEIVETVREPNGSMNLDVMSLSTVIIPEVHEIQSRLDADTVLLSFFFSGARLFFWGLERDRFWSGESPLLQTTTVHLIERQRRYCIRAEQRGAPDWLARTLGEWVGRLRENRKLVCVPAGLLHGVPFESFELDNQPLLYCVQVAYVPSAVSWWILAQRPACTCSSPALVCPGTYRHFPPLPGAHREVEHIRTVYPAARVFVGDMPAETLIDRVSGCGLLHFACHAVFNRERPMESVLQLSDDRQLSAYDLLRCRFDNALVVLSACETGTAQVFTGEELIGFLRAGFFAGANSMIVSRWEVSDEATAELMTTFYSRLQHEPIGAAFRAAQLKVARQPRWEHPFFWTGFCLYGLN